MNQIISAFLRCRFFPKLIWTSAFERALFFLFVCVNNGSRVQMFVFAIRHYFISILIKILLNFVAKQKKTTKTVFETALPDNGIGLSSKSWLHLNDVFLIFGDFKKQNVQTLFNSHDVRNCCGELNQLVNYEYRTKTRPGFYASQCKILICALRYFFTPDSLFSKKIFLISCNSAIFYFQ